MFRFKKYGNDDRRDAEGATELNYSRIPERGILKKSPGNLLKFSIFS